MNRLYQWLSGQARFFRTDTSSRGSSRTVRTEVTVERQGMTLLMGGAAAAGFDTCPLCGNKLTPAQAQGEPPRNHLLRGSTSQERLPVDGPSP